MPLESRKPIKRWKAAKQIASFDLRREITEGFTQIDRRVLPVDSFTGGTHAALKRLKQFLAEGLAQYEERRNHPALDGTSRLSPYLHFGHM